MSWRGWIGIALLLPGFFIIGVLLFVGTWNFVLWLGREHYILVILGMLIGAGLLALEHQRDNDE